jgi:AraC-like DNA-binding protein
MHLEPARAWTVPSLARRVSMSRSAFAARFRAHVGETPLEHLTQWRMVRAARLMRESRGMKLAAIGATVGYESESSFGKVFRRVMGISPGQYRRRTNESTRPVGPNRNRSKKRKAAQRAEGRTAESCRPVRSVIRRNRKSRVAERGGNRLLL